MVELRGLGPGGDSGARAAPPLPGIAPHTERRPARKERSIELHPVENCHAEGVELCFISPYGPAPLGRRGTRLVRVGPVCSDPLPARGFRPMAADPIHPPPENRLFFRHAPDSAFFRIVRSFTSVVNNFIRL